jgi:hypothetical protein
LELYQIAEGMCLLYLYLVSFKFIRKLKIITMEVKVIDTIPLSSNYSYSIKI